MKTSALASILSLSVLLSACPAVSEPDAAERSLRQVGVVSVGASHEENGSYEVYGAGAVFQRMNRRLESLEQVTDRCFLDELPPSLEDGASLLDAGPYVELKANQQPFATLERVSFEGGGYGYTAGEFGRYPAIPEEGLIAEVPGAVFPGFGAAAFPAPPPRFELTPNQSVTMTPDSSFEWVAYRPADGVSLITFQVAPETIDEGPYLLVNCVAADDGEFSFPAETKAALLALDGDYGGSVIAPERSVYRVASKGDAALVLSLGTAPLGYLLR